MLLLVHVFRCQSQKLSSGGLCFDINLFKLSVSKVMLYLDELNSYVAALSLYAVAILLCYALNNLSVSAVAILLSAIILFLCFCSSAPS